MNAIIICTLLWALTVFGSQPGLSNYTDRVEVLVNNIDNLIVKVNLEGLNRTEFGSSNILDTGRSLNGEGMLSSPGMPILPTYSFSVLVPAGKQIELTITSEALRTVRAVNPPELNSLDDNISSELIWQGDRIFPSEPVAVTRTEKFRQYRIAQITYYPVQYDPLSETYLLRSNLEVEISFVDDESLNRNYFNARRIPSPDVQRLLETIVINPPPHRDDQELVMERGYRDHVLIVIPEAIGADGFDDEDLSRIEHLINRLVEWKLQSGDVVDILRIPAGRERNVEAIKTAIQNEYTSMVEDGLEPFDNVLLIGEEDRDGLLHNNNRGGMGLDIRLYAKIGAAIGDTTTEVHPWLGHWDLFYAYLEHDGENEDFIPDVALSRIHAGNLPMLANGINKTLSYESEPFMDDDSWFTEAITAEGPLVDGGTIVTPTVEYYIQVLEHNHKHVVAKFLPNDGGDAGRWVSRQFNDTISFLAARADHRLLAYHNGSNPDRLMDPTMVFPVAIINSGHGEWAMESLFWVGREFYENRERYNDVSGAKGAVVTTGNWMGPGTVAANTVGSGMMHGMLDLRLSFGWARNWALMNLKRTYPENQFIFLNNSNNFTLCGDVSLRQWEGVPTIMNVLHPETMPDGAAYIPVNITDENNGGAMPGVLVTLLGWNEGDLEMRQLAFTDYAGRCEFLIEPGFEGTLQLTATGQDLYPYKGEIQRGDPAGYLDAFLISIDDEAGGNGNGEVNPSERIRLMFSVANHEDNMDADSVSAMLSTSSPFVEIISGQIEFGNVRAGQTVEAENFAEIAIVAACPDGEPIILVLEVTDDRGVSSLDAFRLDPFSPDLVLVNLPDGGDIGDGESELSLELFNNGRIANRNLTATLKSDSWGIEVVQAARNYETIEPGESAASNTNFVVTRHGSYLAGMRVPMMLLLESEGVQVDIIKFELQLGTAANGDPFGPDSYGYYVFDDSDEGYSQQPEYVWIEISEYERGHYSGQPLNIIRGDINNGWGVVELPFTFRYYGRDYKWITVSTNGFIAMGADQFAVPNPQNWSLDGGGVGGPYAMIAPFWENIYVRPEAESGIFTAYAHREDAFVLEWYDLRHHIGDAPLTFQVILYNPDSHPTTTMDGKIEFQYRTIRQQEGDDDDTPYASVGIANAEANSGISYTNANRYPITSAPLGNQRVILFTTTPHHMTGRVYGRVIDSENDGIGDVTVSTSHGGEAVSAEDGSWTIDAVFAETPIELYFDKSGYYTTVKNNLTIPDGGEMEIEVQIIRSRVNIHPPSILSYQETNYERVRPLTIDNRWGTEAIQWSVQSYLPGVENPAPWELRIEVNLTEITGSLQISGVAYADDKFFVTGISEAGEDKIYRLNDELDLIDSFDQPGEGGRAITDLGWDGEFLWGVRSDTLYQFSTDGEIQRAIHVDIERTRTVTWDPENQLIWLIGDDPYIHGLDVEGNEQRTHFIKGLDIRGLAYQPAQPEGFSILAYNYRISPPGAFRQTVHSINPLTGDIRAVNSLDTMDEFRGGETGGAYLTNKYDPDSWVAIFVTRKSAEDILDIFQLRDNIDWFDIQPKIGTTAPGDITTIEARFNSDSLDIGEYEAAIMVKIDILDEARELGVTMHIVGDDRPPIAYKLRSPRNNGYADTTEINFKWYDTYDPNEGEDVSYIFWVSDGTDSVSFVTAADSFAFNPYREFNLEIRESITWWTKAEAAGDTIECDERFTLTFDPSGIGSEPKGQPVEFGLQAIYPNPFNATTSIKVGLDVAGIVKLKVYDITGREVITLSEGLKTAGYHTFNVNAANMASGLYIVRLESRGKVSTKKMILIR